MFFLITHILINKHHPNLVTQFIIGCTCYVVLFLIVQERFGWEVIEPYKYYILTLIAIDVGFLVYQTKSEMGSRQQVETHIMIEPVGCTDTDSMIDRSATTCSLHSSTLSSEIDDYKISHDLDLTSDDALTMFSSSDDAALSSETRTLGPELQAL